MFLWACRKSGFLAEDRERESRQRRRKMDGRTADSLASPGRGARAFRAPATHAEKDTREYRCATTALYNTPSIGDRCNNAIV